MDGRVLFLGADGGEDRGEGFAGFVGFDEEGFLGGFVVGGGKGDDGIGVSVGRDGDVDVLVGQDGGEVGGVPFFAGGEGRGAAADDEGGVAGDMAHELKRRGLGVEDGDCGGVEIVVGNYQIASCNVMSPTGPVGAGLKAACSGLFNPNTPSSTNILF